MFLSALLARCLQETFVRLLYGLTDSSANSTSIISYVHVFSAAVLFWTRKQGRKVLGIRKFNTNKPKLCYEYTRLFHL